MRDGNRIPHVWPIVEHLLKLALAEGLRGEDVCNGLASAAETCNSNPGEHSEAHRQVRRHVVILRHSRSLNADFGIEAKVV